mmetsp:Transcript_5249/g.7257  ORF Transcript_5249/g.7257 Transcript_5249/m.7257 type:complete len:368 (-) Transcript_5249:140-1243(-)
MFRKARRQNYFKERVKVRSWSCGTIYDEECPFFPLSLFGGEVTEKQNKYLSFMNAFGSVMNPQQYSKTKALQIAQSFWNHYQYDENFICEFILNPHDLQERKSKSTEITLKGKDFFRSLGLPNRKMLDTAGEDPEVSQRRLSFQAIRNNFPRVFTRKHKSFKPKVEEKKDETFEEVHTQIEVSSSSPTMIHKSNFLNIEMLSQIHWVLPEQVQGHKWKLLYSLSRDGSSYTSFLQRTKLDSKSLIFIHTFDGEIFGGYVSCSWQNQWDYFGTGESWVFKIETSGKSTNCNNYVMRKWDWSGKNDYYMHFTNSGFGMGGGGGGFAFYIGEDFLEGTTAFSDTFGNNLLASSSTYKISDVEVWGFTQCC